MSIVMYVFHSKAYLNNIFIAAIFQFQFSWKKWNYLFQINEEICCSLYSQEALKIYNFNKHFSIFPFSIFFVSTTNCVNHEINKIDKINKNIDDGLVHFQVMNTLKFMIEGNLESSLCDVLDAIYLLL